MHVPHFPLNENFAIKVCCFQTVLCRMNLVQKTPNKLWMGGQVLKEVGEGDGGIRGGWLSIFSFRMSIVD